MEDLGIRLRSLPRELEPLYNHLLGLIAPVYTKWVSMAFQVVRLARELSSNPFGDGFDTPNGVIPLTISSLYFALDKSVKYAVVKKMTHKDLAEKCVAMSTQMTARCAGFLELSRSNNEAGVQPSSFVQYLHRTARDFVEGPNHWPKVIADTAETPFDPSVVMMKSYLCSLNISCRAATAIEPKWNLSQEPEIRELAITLMIYASYADAQAKTHDLQIKTLDIFDNLMTRHLAKIETDEGVLHWSNDLYTREVNDAQVTSLLELATLFNLTGYVDQKIEGSQPEIATPLLYFLLLPPQERLGASGKNEVLPSEDSYAWCDTCRQTYEPMDESHKTHGTLRLLTARDESLSWAWAGIGAPRPRAKMVSLLLFHGANPNWTNGENSAWENVLGVLSNLLGPPKHNQQALLAAKEEFSDCDSLGDGSSGDEFPEKETSENMKDACSGEVTENYKDSSLARVRREYVLIMKQLACHGVDPRAPCVDHSRTISALQFVKERLGPLFQKDAEDILIKLMSIQLS